MQRSFKSFNDSEKKELTAKKITNMNFRIYLEEIPSTL